MNQYFGGAICQGWECWLFSFVALTPLLMMAIIVTFIVSVGILIFRFYKTAKSGDKNELGTMVERLLIVFGIIVLYFAIMFATGIYSL